MTQKEMLAARFEKNFSGQKLRLLAIQLNGFSHKVFFDRGSKSTPVEVAEYSGYTSEAEKRSYRNIDIARTMLSDISHRNYQNNAQEIIYFLPEDR